MGAERIKSLLLALALSLALAGCTAVAEPSTPMPSPTAAATATAPSVATAAEPAQAPAPSPTILPSPTATLVPTPTVATASTAPAAISRPPDRDPLDLALRFRPGSPAAATPRAAPAYRVGDRHSFWVLDQTTKTYSQVSARLANISDHTYMYAADGVSVDDARLKASAQVFEANTYQTLHKYFGSEWTPGVDNDVHLTILNARVPGVGGYFSSGDEVPKSVNQYSNEREMFYINVEAFEPGTPAYDSTLAHEFTHMIQHNVVRGGETWVNEGTAELGVKAVGQREGFAKYYLDNPDLQLTDWAESPTQTVPHYGAAFLFFDYFAQHYGGYEAVGRLLAEDGRDLADFDAHLARRGLTVRFADIFRDWVAANYLNDDQLSGGIYGYADKSLRARAEPVGRLPARIDGEVRQFGADYYEIPDARGDVTIAFHGAPDVRLVPLDAHGGQTQWWSNRGDSIDSRLTREIDLTAVRQATLRFNIWYDLEAGYDYGFVAASTDNGRTWQTLQGKQTTTVNPNGGNFGHGYTGDSGGGQRPRWVQEEIDLAAFAGKKVLLRFEYVTDDAFNATGFGIDDIAIPEIGFRDDAETESGWYSEGWVRTANRVPEQYSVQILKFGRQTAIERMTLKADQTGTVVVRGVGPGRDVERIVVAVAAMTPLTTEISPFGLEITVP